MDRRLELTYLYDFYSNLLTKKQSQIFESYHFNDFSINEIGEQLGISKQASHATLKKAELLLITYESKLKLYDKHKKRSEIIDFIINKYNITEDIRTDIL